MNSFGKKITLFLIDGDPAGRISAELSNWTGKAYKIPRTRVKDSSDREDLHSTGVYFLLGKDPSDEEKDMVYIGEGENVYNRLKEHLEKKEFWLDAVCFLSKDDNLNKAHIKHLEHRLYHDVLSVRRFRLENDSKPANAKLSEADETEMKEFATNLKLILGALGYRVFEPIEKRSDVSPSDSIVDFHISGKGCNATGYPTDEGFLVCRDSLVSADETPSLQPSYTKFRKRLLDASILVKENGVFKFTEDYLFKSPSTAAAVVLGRSANGRTEWKTNKGVTLADFEQGGK